MDLIIGQDCKNEFEIEEVNRIFEFRNRKGRPEIRRTDKPERQGKEYNHWIQTKKDQEI